MRMTLTQSANHVFHNLPIKQPKFRPQHATSSKDNKQSHEHTQRHSHSHKHSQTPRLTLAQRIHRRSGASFPSPPPFPLLHPYQVPPATHQGSRQQHPGSKSSRREILWQHKSPCFVKSRPSPPGAASRRH